MESSGGDETTSSGESMDMESFGWKLAEKEADFANYFGHYSFLCHQKSMLSDGVRMDAYHTAIFNNPHHFRGKTVLDVGTGSGILAIWAAQVGAKKVYAIESTTMSEHAHTLVKANNLENVVEVIESAVEDAILPEKVDVIISEWMGHFLLRESMFDSVIFARDHWLKPTGVIYPSHARMWMAPIRTALSDMKMDDYDESMREWEAFVNRTKEIYGVDMSVLSKPYSEELEKFYLQTSLCNELHPDQVVGTRVVVKEIDCLTATLADVLEVRAKFSSSINDEDTIVQGFAGWFDVRFRGTKEDPAKEDVVLTTAPSVDEPTHWLQQVLLLSPPAEVAEGDILKVSFVMTRSEENHKLMEVELACDFIKDSGETVPTIKNHFYVQ